MNILFRSCAAVALTLSLQGCFFLPSNPPEQVTPVPYPGSDAPPDAGPEPELRAPHDVATATVEGRFGSVDLAAPLTAQVSETSSSGSVVRVAMTGAVPGGHLELLVAIDAALDDARVTPGTAFLFEPDAETQVPGINVTVAARVSRDGQEAPFYQSAYGTVLHVEPGPTPDRQRFAFTAYFDTPAGRETLDGAFEYTPRR